MSTSAADARAPALPEASASASSKARAYFASDARRTIQTVLGLVWVLDGALQFQSFMYGKGFIQFLQGLTGGQPGWVASSVNQGAATMESHQAIFNTVRRVDPARDRIRASVQADDEAGDRWCRSHGRWRCGGSVRRSE